MYRPVSRRDVFQGSIGEARVGGLVGRSVMAAVARCREKQRGIKMLFRGGAKLCKTSMFKVVFVTLQASRRRKGGKTAETSELLLACAVGAARRVTETRPKIPAPSPAELSANQVSMRLRPRHFEGQRQTHPAWV